MRPREVWHVFKDAVSHWLDDRAPRMGAALAYYSVFSMAPLIVIAIGVAGLIFGRDAAQRRITAQVEDILGGQGADVLNAMIENASQPTSGLVGTALGLAMLSAGAAGLFAELQDDLNSIWQVEPKPDRGVWGIMRDRFLSFSMVMAVAFLLLVSLLISAALSAFVALFGDVQTGVIGHVCQGTRTITRLRDTNCYEPDRQPRHTRGRFPIFLELPNRGSSRLDAAAAVIDGSTI